MKKLIQTLRNIYKIEDLRKRILYTLGIILVYRFGAYVVLPGVDPSMLASLQNQTKSGLLGLLNMFSGGAFSNASVFALGIMPYISASIVVQLLGMAIPYFQKLQKEGELTSRIDIGKSLTADTNQLKKWIELEKRYPRNGNWIRFGYLKGFIDGTIGSGTALMFEPFTDNPSTSGLSMMPYNEFEKMVITADKFGFQIGVHAIGDKGNNWVLNAYEKTEHINGIRDSRHRIEHAQTLRLSDIPRFAKLGVIASMQPTHCISDKKFCEKRIGPERAKGAYAWKSLIDAGTMLAFGTDYQVEPLNPMEGLYAAVTRKDRLGEEGEGWHPEQKIKMEEAIKYYTSGSAYAQFMENRKGMIKSGYLADIVIVDKDLLTIPENQIMKTKVDFTITGGKIVYASGK